VDAEIARWLVSPEAADALARAGREADPGSLAAAQRLRRDLPPDHAAAVVNQVVLRRRAVAKLGAQAAQLYLTSDGLEQATRPAVAAWRAARFAAAGVRTVLDLGCGIGADALAFAAAGLEVIAVESDEATAVLASANLGREVLVGDAVTMLDDLDPDAAVFCDPARRTSAGRSWRVDDLSPPWGFVAELLQRRTACIKLGPGAPHALIPRDVAATWVSERGDLVELSLWSAGWPPAREAVVLPAGAVLGGAAAFSGGEPATPRVGDVLYEPDPAVIRAGLVDRLAGDLDATRLHPGIAYLLGPRPQPTPFATAFTVLDVMDAGERTLRAWVRRERIGTLEIKKRGIDIDPAALRRRLKPAGPASATVVLTPTVDGARALVAQRL